MGNLSSYINDRKIKTVFYFIFLAVLFIIPNILLSVSLGNISYETKLEIRNEMRNDISELPFKIENDKLVCTTISSAFISYENKITSILSVYVGIEPRVPSTEDSSSTSKIYISFLEDGVYIDNSIMRINIFKYSDYSELEGLDLNGAIVDNGEFWDIIFGVSQKYINSFKGILRIVYIGYSLVQAMITILIWSLLITLFNRFGTQYSISFSKQWKLDVYGMTGFVIGNVLANLFGLSLLYYVGLILSLVVCNLGTHNNINRGGDYEL